MATRDDFTEAVNDITMGFPENAASRRILSGEFTLSDYHYLLLSLFHTTYEGPSISALAASHCPQDYEEARQALLRHAAKSSGYWHLVLDDLERTGFQGPDPRRTFPGTEAQAYVAYNCYVALKAPVARLAITAVVDSIASNFADSYAGKLSQCLGVEPEQVHFVHHRKDPLLDVDEVTGILDRLPMTARDWEWVVNATRTAGTLYKAIYDAR